MGGTELLNWSRLCSRVSRRPVLGLDIKGLGEVAPSLVPKARTVRPLELANSSMLYDRIHRPLAMGLVVKGLLLTGLGSGGRVLGGGVKGRRGPFLLAVR